MNQNFSIQRSGSIDAAPELFALPVEKIDVVLIDDRTVEEAQSLISGCERCAKEAEISFDYVLDELTGSDPTRTEYLMSHSARCPRCLADVTEKTLIIPD
jgi:hypothetical protein